MAMLKARDAVRNLKEYHPPLAERTGLRMDFNENTAGCSPAVLRKLREITADDLARYPERAPVERVVAEFLGLDTAQVLLTNGVDEGIHLVCETYLEPEDEVVIVVPTFSMYEIYGEATGARVVAVPAGHNFGFPTANILNAVSPCTRLIAVANPNNPTGAAAEIEDLVRIAQTAPDAALLVDEAYFEFHGQSVIDEIARVPNILVCRTFSKAYGLAGLRIGVLVGHADQIAMVRRVSSPYSVNAAALSCLPAALADQQYIRSYVAQVKTGRAQIEHALRGLGIECWPSAANFVLARIGQARERFVAEMRQRGVLVRDRHHDPGCAGCVRITVGTDEHNQRLLAAVTESLKTCGAIGEKQVSA
jgi:histidinol-phosphate aminotransferase